MEAQEDIETIFTHPDFLAVVREILTKGKAPPSEVGEAIIEAEETEADRRVRFLIELRMKKAYTKCQRVK